MRTPKQPTPPNTEDRPSTDGSTSDLQDGTKGYVLDDQVGFLMRRANQRHLAIFFERLPTITPTQFAALAKLCELGQVSQNELGRRVAMDAATIKGVVDRLRARGFADTGRDPNDQRRLLVFPTEAGRAAYAEFQPLASKVTADTLKPLTTAESERLIVLLNKLA